MFYRSKDSPPQQHPTRFTLINVCQQYLHFSKATSSLAVLLFVSFTLCSLNLKPLSTDHQYHICVILLFTLRHYRLNDLPKLRTFPCTTSEGRMLEVGKHKTIKYTKINTNYNQTIPLSKTRVMAFSGANRIRTKIVIQDSPIEQVPDLKYLGCSIT